MTTPAPLDLPALLDDLERFLADMADDRIDVKRRDAYERLSITTAALRAVQELADDLDSYVAARGRPATGTYDDGVNRAQSSVAADLRSALAAALSPESVPS